MTGKIRLDQLLANKGMAETRERAKAMIMAGLVLVEGMPADKPGRQVPLSAAVSVKARLPYVSRGGLKLEAALEHFAVDVKGRTVLDIGASTGGFTDCLLQRGARRVIAVDVGYGQLAWRLRRDPRVVVIEKTNARFLEPKDVDGPADGAVVDVSFISLRLIVPPVSRLLAPRSFIVTLIKPQFEVGRDFVGKGGVVREAALHSKVIHDLGLFFAEQGWTVQGHIPSPIPGPKGNIEFLMYLTR